MDESPFAPFEDVSNIQFAVADGRADMSEPIRKAEKLSGTALVEALKDGLLSKPETTLIGMVKSSDKMDAISFTMSGCEHWIDIPTNLVEEAEHIGQNVCKDHFHPLIRLTLRTSKSAESEVLASLLAEVSSSNARLTSFSPLMGAAPRAPISHGFPGERFLGQKFPEQGFPGGALASNPIMTNHEWGCAVACALGCEPAIIGGIMNWKRCIHDCNAWCSTF